MSWPARWLPVLLASLAGPCAVSAQGTPGGCSAIELAESQLLFSSRTFVAGDASHPAGALVQEYVMTRWRADTSTSTTSRLEERSQALVTELRADTAGATDAARVLSAFIANSMTSSTVDHARVAASLYAEWRLPVAPARSVLVDRQSSVAARRWALAALSGHFQDAWFLNDALLVLCDLGARSAGAEIVWGRSMDSDPWMRVRATLAHDERELLLAVIRAAPNESWSVLQDRVRQWVGDSNAVTRLVLDRKRR